MFVTHPYNIECQGKKAHSIHFGCTHSSNEMLSLETDMRCHCMWLKLIFTSTQTYPVFKCHSTWAEHYNKKQFSPYSDIASDGRLFNSSQIKFNSLSLYLSLFLSPHLHWLPLPWCIFLARYSVESAMKSGWVYVTMTGCWNYCF